MVKPVPAPTAAEIAAAFDAAARGKGRKLAEMVKSVSTDDLATAFGRIGMTDPTFSLGRALNFAAGIKEQRAIQAIERRQWRKERRAAP